MRSEEESGREAGAAGGAAGQLPDRRAPPARGISAAFPEFLSGGEAEQRHFAMRFVPAKIPSELEPRWRRCCAAGLRPFDPVNVGEFCERMHSVEAGQPLWGKNLNLARGRHQSGSAMPLHRQARRNDGRSAGECLPRDLAPTRSPNVCRDADEPRPQHGRRLVQPRGETFMRASVPRRHVRVDHDSGCRGTVRKLPAPALKQARSSRCGMPGGWTFAKMRTRLAWHGCQPFRNGNSIPAF